MSANKQEKAEILARKAREMAASERDRFLDVACRDDEELRHTVQILVEEANGEATRALDVEPEATRPVPAESHDATPDSDATRPLNTDDGHHPTASSTSSSPAASGPSSSDPDTIGPYRILELIGTGGMGRVYLAEQTEPVQRQVAIKILRAAIPDRDQQLRFMAERQAMARLTHPNIAQLYDAGTLSDGSPYFVMEHVQGQPLTTYADTHNLTIQDRLELFQAVCDGAAYAHMKGILHRDLKPENILVADYGGRGQPKIIDFGVAKAVDAPLIEEALHTGMVALGTLPYMPPEALQHKDGVIDLDFRSDVYALGVILYELLTGRRPYEQGKRAVAAVVAHISAGQAPPPSASLRTTRQLDLDRLARSRQLDVTGLKRRLQGDLDWIAMRAIEADRDRRYPSVNALSADLKRYLRFEPVHARPPSALYRMRKFARRHRVLTGFGLLAAVALGMGVWATAFGMLKAREAESQAVAQARIAEEGRQAAEQATDLVMSLFLDADPFRPGGQTGGEDMTALELLDHSANRLLESGLIAHPEMRVRLMSSLAEVLMRIDQTDKAEALLIGAEAVRDRAGLTEGMTPVRLRSALANLAEVKADYVAAEQHYRQAYHQARALLGPDDPEVGRLRTDLAKIILSQGDAARAEPFLQAAMESTRRTLGVQHEHFVNAINALAFAHYAQGEFEQAEHYFRETLRLAFPEQSPDDPSVAVTQNNLALALLRQEKIDEAEDLIQKAIDNFERSLPAGHWRQANARTVLAACHLARGEMETAESMLLAHYPKIVEARGENSPYAKEIRSQIVQLYDRWDRPAEADPFRECPDRPNCPAEDDAGGDPETGS